MSSFHFYLKEIIVIVVGIYTSAGPFFTNGVLTDGPMVMTEPSKDFQTKETWAPPGSEQNSFGL